MKPPPRRRAAPARYLGEVTGPATWSAREKRQLLRLLQARQGQPEPDAAELARELRGRSEAEIRVFLQQLKGRVAREAIQKLHPGGLLGPRRQEAQPPAPIEVRQMNRTRLPRASPRGVWTDLAEKITGPLEEALAVAFSQVLTIAATEPITLLHSRPPKSTKAHGKPLILSVPGRQEDAAPETPSSAPKAPSSAPETSGPAPEKPSESLAGPSTEDFTVDFEKIYKYLSSFSRSGRGPELSAAESAVVLDLLMSLPEELPLLPCTALVEHMMETYLRLTAPQPSPAGGSLGPAAEGDGAASKAPEETRPAPEKAEGSKLKSPWQAAGICPLNPFLVPLELLGRVATPAR
ncbi:snRNA-activating protein complex subunit 2 isoform X2 [Saimiri boliviensis]|nr:snRNA-activating protein complex subunit 2 isoform X2 [Saimiri boliviensis boliviensis]